MKFKVGDRVIVRADCSGAIRGIIYRLSYNNVGLLACFDSYGAPHCNCQNNWILVSEKKRKIYGIVNFCKKYYK